MHGEVLPGVHRIFDTFVNVYLVDRGDHLVAVDTGLETTCGKILDAVTKIGKPLTAIVLTHGHLDHTGSLKCLKGRTNALVAAHRDEVELIKEKTGLEPDVELMGGDVFEGFRVLHKPGHTRGSICLLDEKSRSLFVGDLVIERGGKLEEVPHQYSLDPEMNRRRIRELLEVDFENLLPAHGEPLLGNGKEKLRELVERLGL
ncbi:MBL fold metallo-hydrolase [Thermococcus waiotapuensis]|uniref:MBL fold metallo-hydrolase n=1 Tax=Thermococcus waiotapuensis TaxID=90909 RepID=A0AAE4T452_9EURY|nr:MBL fold metallo-hydrolase [Thermococcus waiotapuensis]MDV3104513.1 MBL fold metallo-hydrolase [Thermococcus waiotapuensis]